MLTDTNDKFTHLFGDTRGHVLAAPRAWEGFANYQATPHLYIQDNHMNWKLAGDKYYLHPAPGTPVLLDIRTNEILDSYEKPFKKTLEKAYGKTGMFYARLDDDMHTSGLFARDRSGQYHLVTKEDDLIAVGFDDDEDKYHFLYAKVTDLGFTKAPSDWEVYAHGYSDVPQLLKADASVQRFYSNVPVQVDITEEFVERHAARSLNADFITHLKKLLADKVPYIEFGGISVLRQRTLHTVLFDDETQGTVIESDALCTVRCPIEKKKVHIAYIRADEISTFPKTTFAKEIGGRIHV